LAFTGWKGGSIMGVSLKRKIELIRRSTDRLERGMNLEDEQSFWIFLRKELWLHWKRTTEALLMVLRKKL